MTRVVTKSAVIETFLANLDAMKERGVTGAELALPPWASRDDSDVRSFECAGPCKAELPAGMAVTCNHCGQGYCALCLERHGEWLKGRRV